MSRFGDVRALLGRSSDFRWFFCGRLISLIGSSMAPVALAFAVLDASDSASALGVVLAAHMIPFLGFLLVGGATADRFSRRAVLVCSNAGAAVTQGCVAAIFLTGHFSISLVATLECLNGVLTAFTNPALRGLVPELVSKGHLQQANALLGWTRSATKILGPSISGICVVAIGSGPAIAVDALTYLLAAGCLLRLNSATSAPVRRSAGLLKDIRDGWSQYRGISWVWRVSLAFCVINLVQTGTWQILGPSLTEELSSKATWGFVLSAQGVGLLVMNTLMFRFTSRYLLRAGQLFSALGAVPLLLLGAHAGPAWLIVGGFIAGAGGCVGAIAWDTSLQDHVPSRVLSRVTSYDDLLSFGAIPIGQLCVGPLASQFGEYVVVTLAGTIFALAAIAPLASATVRCLPNTSAAGAADVMPAKNS
ncbi:MFS transporter [Streptomyces sp. SID8379]|uniref:MFS transporter n=1 Tax=Streptomyces sp. HmicA12 TaxID=1156844 RepID=UPI0007C4AB7B|nr:MFS transporter [Streptomyces sp. SID8379]